MPINWFRVGTGVLAGIFLSLVLYGAYRFYLDKPVPIINNSTFQADSKPTITQGASEKYSISIGLLGGPLYLDHKIGAFVGGLVSYRF